MRRPTVFFLHGKSGDSAIPGRVAIYSTFFSRFNVNVLTIDCRGFADSDSTGIPTVAAGAADPRIARNYLIAEGAEPRNILIHQALGRRLGASSLLSCKHRIFLPVASYFCHPSRPSKPLISCLSITFLSEYLSLLKPLVIVPALSGKYSPYKIINTHALAGCMTRMLSHRSEL